MGNQVGSWKGDWRRLKRPGYGPEDESGVKVDLVELEDGKRVGVLQAQQNGFRVLERARGEVRCH
ncbi:hypothetical protein CROQUDRAFT_170346 [Cronartium quercuum f. sp. fusiforme G11]|uniref:Uncharacterized protein n=1 Tax=Cronartium quercuum f. sp. fusiforme G11 TaxID=708437 RepID=A0A9P6T9K6_9BASI|nr:hypothetical protein CROQUDRAFT_170346 [Cronartium quercuum f. sp. fusiforme G11]